MIHDFFLEKTFKFKFFSSNDVVMLNCVFSGKKNLLVEMINYLKFNPYVISLTIELRLSLVLHKLLFL
jgi:hypothetical protein